MPTDERATHRRRHGIEAQRMVVLPQHGPCALRQRMQVHLVENCRDELRDTGSMSALACSGSSPARAATHKLLQVAIGHLVLEAHGVAQHARHRVVAAHDDLLGKVDEARGVRREVHARCGRRSDLGAQTVGDQVGQRLSWQQRRAERVG